ncbi:MAG: DUF1513 domain-containing protein [Burkholderiaceae bacterium]
MTEALRRRQLLLGLAGLACVPAWATGSPQLLAAWQYGADQHIGLFGVDGERLSPGASLVVPTRAHGLLAETGGTVLAAARRPGDWLLRWNPSSGKTQWDWMDEDRRLNGHVIASGAGLLTTETDRESGRGLLGVRDAASLEKADEWPTHGMDPHQLLVLPSALGRWPAGTVIVANGGIPTLPETGRARRQAERMDSSLAALDPRGGKLLGQWRLADPYLSIRHLAWNAKSATLGIALQAEHPDATAKAAAPVLAVWNGDALTVPQRQPALQGYAGDICMHGRGFIVSCPRADALALFDANAGFIGAIPHGLAYALAERGGNGWVSGREAALHIEAGRLSLAGHPSAPAAAWQFDNHWQLVSG